MSETLDRRAARTQKALKSAMLELLKKKEISKITVAELAERADIGRGTFYLHYTDPYDLLDKIENEALDSVTAFAAPISDTRRYVSLMEHLEHVWEHIYNNKELFSILMMHQDGARFIKKFHNYSEKAALTAAGVEAFASVEELYSVTYVISGTLGIFQRWMEDGATMPPGTLAGIARDAIGAGPEA